MRHESAIRRLCQALRLRYGSGIRDILLFGSVARGTDGVGSDIDIMVVLGDEMNPVDWRMERAIRDVAFPIELEQDVVFDLKVVAEREVRGLRGHTQFMERVAAEGVSV